MDSTINFKKVAIKKIKKLTPNWIMGSLFVFLISYFIGSRKENTNFFSEYLTFFIGYGSIYYFMTILFFFYFYFYYRKNKINEKSLAIYFILNLLSTTLSIKALSSFSYLNPFNFIFYFVLGMYFHNNKNTFINIKKYKKILGIFFIIFIILKNYYNVANDYFGSLNFIFLIITILLFINIKKIKILDKIGENSYFIYCYHLSFIGALNRILFGYPILKALIICFLFLLMDFILKKIRLTTNSLLKYKKD